MMSAKAERTETRVTNGAAATVPSEIVTISAERTKSVRTAPLIFSFSIAARSTSGLRSAPAS
jgi:hypothetical protein